MNKNISFLLLLCIGAILPCKAQSIKRSVIGSTGKVMNNGIHTISHTLGEMATNRYTALSGIKLNQGFQKKYVNVNTPLPVSWLRFNVIRKSNVEVTLAWDLSNEKNCKGFYVERLLDGENTFTEIAFIQSVANNGNSDMETNYEYLDTRYNNSRAFYRIKQVDMDDKISYSETKIVYGTEHTDVKMDIWPIPAHTTINIMLNGLGKNANLLIMDMNGKIVRSLPVKNQDKAEVNGLANGMYIVQLDSDKTISQKILVQ